MSYDIHPALLYCIHIFVTYFSYIIRDFAHYTRHALGDSVSKPNRNWKEFHGCGGHSAPIEGPIVIAGSWAWTPPSWTAMFHVSQQHMGEFVFLGKGMRIMYTGNSNYNNLQYLDQICFGVIHILCSQLVAIDDFKTLFFATNQGFVWHGHKY